MKDSKIYIQQIGQCENKAGYEMLVDENKALYIGWKEFITPLMCKNRLSAKKVAEGCNVSLTSALSFARMIPSKRENIIMLCMMLKMTMDETNEVLMNGQSFKNYMLSILKMQYGYILSKEGAVRNQQFCLMLTKNSMTLSCSTIVIRKRHKTF
ncbi:MAG: hypothetical protein K2N61_09965 [Lachnospiraceae bacterium]|nr:hypothetical protein [Lachnospiraceae bacterium]